MPPVSAATSPEASASSSHPLYEALWVPSRSRSGATYERVNGFHAADTPARFPSGVGVGYVGRASRLPDRSMDR